jgi:3-oxoacyl-[acyl-carrier protein] reductase
MYDLSEKVIIVTGSGRGIVNAIALKLANEEATVVINTKKRIDELNETLEEKKFSESIAVPADAATREGCRELTRKTVEKYARIDILVNDSDLGLFSWFINADDKLIDKQLAVSLKSVIYCTQEVGKKMMSRD